MDLQKFNFPESDIFSDMETNHELLAESKRRGYYNGNTPYNDLFSNLFFNGGKLNLKKELDEKFRQKALSYLFIFMRSYEPSHEDKEAICAMILSELVDIKMEVK